MDRKLRAIYIPIESYTLARSNESSRINQQVQILDYLKAKYNDLFENIVQYSLFTVTDSEEGQADAIAYKFYGVEDFWWIICAYNKIIHPILDIKTGVRLKIPNLQNTTIFLNQRLDSETASLQNTIVTI